MPSWKDRRPCRLRGTLHRRRRAGSSGESDGYQHVGADRGASWAASGRGTVIVVGRSTRSLGRDNAMDAVRPLEAAVSPRALAFFPSFAQDLLPAFEGMERLSAKATIAALILSGV